MRITPTCSLNTSCTDIIYGLRSRVHYAYRDVMQSARSSHGHKLCAQFYENKSSSEKEGEREFFALCLLRVEETTVRALSMSEKSEAAKEKRRYY